MLRFFRRKKRYYCVGDILPADAKGLFGAFIQVDPETNRIVNIFIP